MNKNESLKVKKDGSVLKDKKDTGLATQINEAKKAYGEPLSHNELINWDDQILKFKKNPPDSLEDAARQVVLLSTNQSSTSNEDQEILIELLLSNPAIVSVLKKFIV